MKTCSYCGRDNDELATHCCECGTAFLQDIAPSVNDWPSFSLFPRSAEEWNRSFAYPLLAGCVVTLYFTGGRFTAITNGFLAFLGMALASTCIIGTGLRRGFRLLALIVALLSVLGGMLMPELAE